MAKCKDCKHIIYIKEGCFFLPWCPIFDDCYSDIAERDCEKFEEMSNADRIRHMSDEDLVEVIPCPYINDDYDECIYGWHEQEMTCEECKLQWLKEKNNQHLTKTNSLQIAREPLNQQGNPLFGYCPNCGTAIYKLSNLIGCKECLQRLKWKE